MPSEYQFSVCPHDTAKNLLGWFTLNTYLQRKLGVGIHFEPQDNFLVERGLVLAGGYHLVYANPFSALRFAEEKGFVPVARPLHVEDQTLVVARRGAALPAAARVASATDQLIIHQLGLQVLHSLAIDIAGLSFDFVGNHLNAAAAVIHGKADLGFVFNETWTGMAESSRGELQVLGASQGGHAFHCFMVSPPWSDRREVVQRILCGMHEEPSGVKVLADLRFTAFEPIGIEALGPLAAMVAA